jgi:hypothetical protein
MLYLSLQSREGTRTRRRSMIHRGVGLSSLGSLSLSPLLGLSLPGLPCRPDGFCFRKYLTISLFLYVGYRLTASISTPSLILTRIFSITDLLASGLSSLNLMIFQVSLSLSQLNSMILSSYCSPDCLMLIYQSCPLSLSRRTLPTPHPSYPYYQRTRMRSLNWRNPRARCIIGKQV